MTPTTESGTPHSPRRLLISGWFYLLFAIGLTVWLLVRLQVNLDARSWPKADAEIIRSELVAEKNRSVTWCISLSYRYVVDGRRYASSQGPKSSIASPQCHALLQYMQAHLKKRQPGDRITVRYDPQDPQRAVAYPGGAGFFDFIFPPIALSFFAVGVTRLRRARRLGNDAVHRNPI